LISNRLPEKGRAQTGESQQKSQQATGLCAALSEFGETRI
jgi:hypothetical protein